MTVNVLVALLFSLVFVVGVLLGMYVTCLSYGRAETRARRREMQVLTQKRNIRRQRRQADSADWWKPYSSDDSSDDWDVWKSDPRDFPR